MLRFRGFHWTTAAAALLLLTGCSLLRLSVSTGEPLSKEETRMRLLTRGFYYEASDEVAATADSIAAGTDDAAIQRRTIRWKLRTTRAALSAAMQQAPELAVLDTWMLYRNMDSLLAACPDSLLFGPDSPLARRTASRLHRKARHLASELLTPERYDLMGQFVAAQPLPTPDSEVQSERTMLPWVDFLQTHGIETDYPVGTIAEVMADMSDRIGGTTQQTANALDWTGDLVSLRIRQDSLRDRLAMQLDSLERNFNRLTAVAEDLPGLSREMAAELNAALAEAMTTFNAGVDNAFDDIDRQRMALQHYVSAERKALIAQAQQATDDAVANIFAALPAFVGKVVLWIILLVVVLMGLPFLLGFWAGGWRERTRRRKPDPEEKA